MTHSKAIHRQEKIMRSLFELQSISVQSLAKDLEVSEWTIRRDLELLEEQRLIQRFYGGARLNDSAKDNYFLPVSNCSKHEYSEGKRHIGKAVVKLLGSQQRIALGAGTTTFEVAQALVHHPRTCSVVTNALDIAQALAQMPCIKLTCTGGDVHGDYSTLVGPVTEKALKMHYFDLAIIGVSGVASKQGLTVNSQLNVGPLSIMIEHASRVIVVADSSKFSQVSFAHLAGLEVVDMVVTDSEPPLALREHFKELGADLVVAKPS